MHAGDTGANQPRHLLGPHAPGGNHRGGEVRLLGAESEQVVEAGVHAEQCAGRVNAVEARKVACLPPGLPDVERVVEGAVERPRDIAELGGERPADVAVDIEARREKSERHALGAEREILAGKPDQTRELATLGREPAGEPQRHSYRNVDRARDGADCRRLDRAGLVVDPGAHLEPVGAALLGVLGVGRVQRDDLDQPLSARHHDHLAPGGSRPRFPLSPAGIVLSRVPGWTA